LITLESLGWNPAWEDHFKPYGFTEFFPGRICMEHKELYHFYAARGEGRAPVSGRLRHEAGGRADFPTVGDWVVLRQASAYEQAVIHAVLPRLNKFSRKVPGKETEEQIIAANLDTLFLVTSLNRDLNPRRLERYLTALSAPHVQPVLILNKSDLCDRPREAVAEVQPFVPGVPILPVSARTGEGLESLLPYLGLGRTVAMIGSSGVGKSTLLNRLLGEEWQQVREIRANDGRGRHTTTHREMIRLPQGGLLIDNPGMRELQIWDEDANLDGTFADIAALAEQCFFPDCRHQQEPRCAVKQAVADGLLDANRLANYEKMQRELAYLESRRDAQVERERKNRVKRIHRMYNKEKRRRGNR
jgi:ribosome biogenesis GTPase